MFVNMLRGYIMYLYDPSSHTSLPKSFAENCRKTRLSIVSNEWPPTLGMVLWKVPSTISPSPLLYMGRVISRLYLLATRVKIVITLL